MIRPSASRQIAALVADLGSGRAATREAAMARLTVIGARAVEPLAALLLAGAPPTRIAALRTLEAIPDSHARGAILRAVDDPDPAVAAAAVSAAGLYLREPRGAEALDRLSAVALDRSRDAVVRASAVRALSTLEAATVAPLLNALRDDPHAVVREAAQSAGGARGRTGPDAAAILAAAARGDLPADPALLRQAVVSEAAGAALPDLLRVIEAVRDRESRETGDRRAPWQAARAAAHLALARRGSRIGLYDLRESLESDEGRQPVEFLAALSAVGDAACLEAIAAAHDRARDEWWREHLAAAFRTIVSREGLTRRHAAIRKIEKRWPAILKR